MSALFRIVYAAHANGTHHKLALDALNHMQRPDAEAWQRLFLKHAAVYMEGSKDPDNKFKDFKNHVLHVGEKYWGGAPEKVEAWYHTTVTALSTGQWADAVYSAGVLSHYYTDPIHPFHTGQTEAENAIHRACEWSINRSYNVLRKLGEDQFSGLTVALPDGAHWPRQATCDGAEFSHRAYEKLIAHYDIHRGTVRPEEGLDAIARPLVAELLIYAATGFGRILDRAISDAGVAAPAVSLTLDTILATLKIPQKALAKRLTNAEDKKLVQAMYDELKATGRVEHTLPEDDRTIRELHAIEVLAPAMAARAEQRAARVPGGAPVSAPAAAPTVATADTALRRAVENSAIAKDKAIPPPAMPTAHQAQSVKSASLISLPPRSAAPRTEPEIERRQPAPDLVASVPAIPKPAEPKPVAPEPVASEPVASVPTASEPVFAQPQNVPAAISAPAPQSVPVPMAVAPPPVSVVPPISVPPVSVPSIARFEPKPDTRIETERNERRSYLAMADDLEAAPSIGPKMAQRFAELGINTVADFMGHDPHDMAELLDDDRIDADTLVDWQDQAQLVIDVPGVRGTHAQLLVGAGYRTADMLAEADPVDLSADVLTFATSADGKRILRDGATPDLEKIKGWVESAREVMAA